MSASLLIAVRWRWRRFVVRRRRLLVSGLLVFALLGFAVSDDLRLWWVGTVLSGRPPVRGQILVRPVIPPGVVRDASVTLVPVAPSSLLAVRVPRPAPPVLVVGTDFAGRWAADRVARGWHYVVLVEAEGCSPRFAGPLDVGWLSASRVDARVPSCLPDAPVPPGCG